MGISDSELSLIEALVSEHPVPGLTLRLVKEYRERGFLDRAKEALTRLLALNPSQVEARSLLSEILEEQGEIEAAMTHLMGVVREFARQAGAFTQLARLMAAQGRGHEATWARGVADALTSPLLLQPSAGSEPETATMAEIFASQGHVDKALGIYRALAGKDPGNPELSRRLAELEDRAGRAERNASMVGKLEALRAAALRRAASQAE